MPADPHTLAILDDLRKLPAEAPWAEFKENNADAAMIGKLISALSNAARLADQPFGYVVWGVRDGDHAAVGTSFEPAAKKESGQPLNLWLAQRLQPSVDFRFESIDYHGKRLILLTNPPPRQPRWNLTGPPSSASAARPRACRITPNGCGRFGPSCNPMRGKPGSQHSS